MLAGGAGDDLELDQEEWAAVCPREITPEQWRRFEGYMLEIFTETGVGTEIETEENRDSVSPQGRRPVLVR